MEQNYYLQNLVQMQLFESISTVRNSQLTSLQTEILHSSDHKKLGNLCNYNCNYNNLASLSAVTPKMFDTVSANVKLHSKYILTVLFNILSRCRKTLTRHVGQQPERPDCCFSLSCTHKYIIDVIKKQQHGWIQDIGSIRMDTRHWIHTSHTRQPFDLIILQFYSQYNKTAETGMPNISYIKHWFRIWCDPA